MTDILMPKLSDSMEEGTILSWLKQSGDRVEVGDELLEIETDKSTVTYSAEAAGVLEIIVDEGTTVGVGEAIARVREGVPAAPAETVAPESPTADNDDAEAATSPAAPATETLIGSSAVDLTAASRPVGANGNGNGAARPAATPLARRVAAAHGVALEEVRGTGPLGRITRADVLGRAGLPAEPSPLPALRGGGRPNGGAPVQPAATMPDDLPLASTRREPSRLQQLIARRMAEAKSTVPHFQVQTEVTMDAALALRSELKALTAENDPVPSLNDLIVKAAAIALREHPLANGSFRDGAFELHEAVNIGVAVAADDALVVPTVLDAAGKSLGQIARETRALAARVRSGEITPAELSSGTFTISNLGMFGMTAIFPVINPPQAAILGVGATRTTLARVDGEVVDRTLLTLTLSCDHRILYGADASRFLARIRELLERPLAIAL